MTIVDSLKAKGSTGGNNIAEAIKNLPMGGGNGNEFVIHELYDESREAPYYLDKSFSEILGAIRNGLTPVIYSDEETNETHIHRYKFSFVEVESDDAEVGERDKYNQIRFVGHSFVFNPVDNNVTGKVLYAILLGDETLIEDMAPLDT